MAKISHTKIKQPSLGEKRPKLTYNKISRFTVFLEQYALSQIQYPGYHKYIMIKYSVEITCSQIHWSAIYTCLSVWNLEVTIWFQGGVSTYSHNQASRLKKFSQIQIISRSIIKNLWRFQLERLSDLIVDLD